MDKRLSDPTQAQRPVCESAEMCASHHSGHGLGALQDRLARATARHWVDALVVDADTDGWITLASLDDSVVVRVWNHTAPVALIGEPVALHPIYHVLAAGSARYNVAIAANA